MKLIYPSVDLWLEYNHIDHVARCARVCYASKNSSEESNRKLVDSLENKGHLSMFRHESRYYIVEKKNYRTEYNAIYNKLRYYLYCPYINFAAVNGELYIVTNGQFLRDKNNADLIYLLNDFEVSFMEFEHSEVGYDMLRLTFCIITQISTSRELNRVSPNNIAEQSTRYVNFGKKGGITICLPHWWYSAKWYKKLLFKAYWKSCELMYNFALKIGFKPEDARGVLPLDTATKVVYTYSIPEWKHIADLRWRDKTGKAHPNAKRVIGDVVDIADENGYEI